MRTRLPELTISCLAYFIGGRSDEWKVSFCHHRFKTRSQWISARPATVHHSNSAHPDVCRSSGEESLQTSLEFCGKFQARTAVSIDCPTFPLIVSWRIAARRRSSGIMRQTQLETTDYNMTRLKDKFEHLFLKKTNNNDYSSVIEKDYLSQTPSSESQLSTGNKGAPERVELVSSRTSPNGKKN